MKLKVKRYKMKTIKLINNNESEKKNEKYEI